MQSKITFLVSMIILLVSTAIYSQNIYEDYQDGKIYLKIRNESEMIFHSLDEVNASNKFRALSYIFNQYQITSIERPFIQLKTPIFDRTYEIIFQNPSDVDRLMKELNSIAYIEYAERVELLRTTLTPNDPGVGQQYSLANIQAFDAWDIHTGGNAVVAIVDDAVRITHTDIAPNVWVNTGEIANNGIDDDNNGYIDDVNGFDVADNDGNPNPPASAADFTFSHGTHCAGIASGATNNGNGIASIGFNNKIMAVKSTSDAGNPQFVSNGYQGVSYAIVAGADVISMSWGGTGSTITAQNIFNQAHNAGITLVAAAGNDNVTTVFYPAGYNFVISVAATNQNDQKSSFSNYGSWIDICAPGSSILSTVATSTTSYQNYDGTSMACPMVAGLCGLLKSYDSSLSPDNIEFCITNSADNIDAQNSNYINQLGAGRINAFTTLQCSNPSNPPVADFNVSQQGTLCPGVNLQFFDVSIFNPTAWSWSFPGGTPSTSNQQNPSVTYNNIGTYNVSLTVTNQYGNDTKTQNGYVTVGVNGIEEFFFEDFESGISAWTVNNPDNAVTWTDWTVGGTQGGAGAAGIDNYNYNAPGQNDALISPILDFSGRSNVTLEFDYAHRRYSADYADSLIVSISTNGGASYNTIFAEAETGTGNFATNTFTTSQFIPASIDDWCFGGQVGASCPSFDLSAYDGLSNIVLRFENINDYGNNTFLDNISFKSSCSIPSVAPTANFTSSNTEGCAPFTVGFTDQSTGNPTSWSWVISGPNNFSSTLQNPTFTLNTPGTYSVSLVVTNASGNNNVVQNNYITVHPISEAGFSFNNNNGTVNFTNTSNTTGNVTYSWDFGDSNSSSAMNPFHTYAQSGTYAVVLTITDDCGSDSFTQNVTVTINNTVAPTASFTANNTTGCVPFTVNFTDQSSGNPTSWSWVISGPENLSSNNQNPNFTFNTPGSYNVSLVVTNSIGNNTSVQNNFIIATPDSDANFTFNENNGLVNFTNSSSTTGSVSYAWNFGDSNSSNQMNPAHTYNQSGNYSVTLTITDDCGTHTITQTVNVNIDNTSAPTAGFTSNITTGCVPFTVNFTDQSAGAPSSWAWVVSGPDNLTSDVQNPSFVFSTEGNYNVTLTVNNSAGGNTVQQNNYIIANPASFADFAYFDDNGEVSFSNTSNTTGNATYAWDFGDGNTSSMENPTHTFTNGLYNVSLTITDDCGTDTYTESLNIIILGLDDLEGINDWNIFPNPSNGLFNISIDGTSNEDMKIEIMDLLGRTLLTQSLGANTSDIIPLDVRHLSKGTYFIRLSDENGQDVKKVIIH